MLPTFLREYETDERPVVRQDLGLHVGRITKIHYPDEATNFSKMFIEYDISCLRQASPDALACGITRIPYARAILASDYSGVAESTHWTLRVNSREESERFSGGLGTPVAEATGSMVLFACVDGNPKNAVILGCFPHGKTGTEYDSVNGHNLSSVFNGFKNTINKDGEYELFFTGPTNPDGTPVSQAIADKGGSLLRFSKDGSVTLSSGGKSSSNEPQSITLSTPDKQVQISTQALVINGGSQAFVRGSAYRDAEKALFDSLANRLSSACLDLVQVGLQLAAAGGALAVPVTGPPAAAPFIAQCAVDVSKAANELFLAAADIRAFEAKSTTFLSSKHKLD